MKGIVRTVAAGLAATTALTLTVGTASAGGYAIREQSAYGQGSSFAGVAAGGASISTMFWNPATITQHPGTVIEGNATLIWPHSEIEVHEAYDPLGNSLGTQDSGELGIAKVVPSTYVTYQVNEDLFLGLAVNTPFGLVTDADLDWSGRYHSRTSDLFTINVNPNIAYRVNDFVSIGVGLQAQWIDARLTNGQFIAQSVPTPAGLGTFIGEGDADLVGNDLAVGFTAGITFTPTERTTIGLGFRSAIDHKLEGDAEVYNISGNVFVPGIPVGIPTSLGSLDLGDVTADVTTPEMVSLGIRHQLTDRWTLLGTAEWTNWSRFDELRVEFDDPARPDNVTVEEWDDGWFFALGAEYQWSPELTLRGGLAYEISPIPDDTRTPRLPDSNRFWMSVGATYKIKERLSLDIGYSHIIAEEAPIELDGTGHDLGRGGLFGEGESSVDIFSAAIRYKFGGDPVPVPPTEPLLRKP